MFKQIKLQDLRIGMYVADTGLPWTEHPHLYCTEGKITSREQIESIRAKGYLKVFIDTDRGEVDGSEKEDAKFGSAESSMSKATAKAPPKRKAGEARPPKKPINEEIVVAKKVYSESIRFAKSFIASVHQGEDVDYKGTEEVVDGLLESLTRNHEALISIGKLRAYDEYTFTHCVNVAVLSLSFAKFLNLPEWQYKPLGVAAFLHDIGKARIPHEVLNKPGKLTDAEFEIIKSHPLRSYEVLRDNTSVPKEVLRGIVEHHEKFDCSGYPRKLCGANISLYGRIISLADVFDAISSKRVYKDEALPHTTLKIMYGMRNGHFDPGLLSSFIKFLGIYPVGSLVKLSNDEYGVVLENNGIKANAPRVMLAYGPDLSPMERRTVDLSSKSEGGLTIVGCLDPKGVNIDPVQCLMG